MSRRASDSLRSLFIVLLAVGAGCGEPVGPSEFEPIQTDLPVYELRENGDFLEAGIGYTFTNRTDSRVYLANCRGGFDLRLDRLTDSGWEEAWRPVLQRCQSPPIIIERGEAFGTVLGISAGLPGTRTAPQFNFDDPVGTYRLVWLAATAGSESGDELPLDARVSNSFRLERP